MNFRINFSNLTRQLLPPHKRQPVRLAFLRSLVSPLRVLFTDFYVWCSNSIVMLNVNSQVKVLEGYLRKKYNQPISIKIVTFKDRLLQVGLEQEGDVMMPRIGLVDEKIVEISLDGEIRELFGNADFIVYIPLSVDISLIQSEIEKYKLALIKYTIIQQ